MKHPKLTTTLVISCALLAVACGGKKTPSAKSTTTVKPNTPAAPGTVSPLTGLPLSDAAVLNRPLLTVKIDNHPDARPQFGIDRADVIVEEKVEGGLSRFMALFQSQDSNMVGPVRSLRTTDANWLRPEGGMIAYSGGIPQVIALLAPNGIYDIGADTHGTKYYKRRSDRPFEHSMYVDTTVLRDLTPRNAPAAKPLFQFLTPGQTFTGAGIQPVTSISLRMADLPTATYFDWTWDAKSGKFMRGTEGKAHTIENSGQIGMTNVIVQFTTYSSTPWRDVAKTPVDQADVTGGGDAWILSAGQLIKGHWSRPTAGDITSYTDSSGATIKLQPGQTWISLVPPNEPNQVR